MSRSNCKTKKNSDRLMESKIIDYRFEKRKKGKSQAQIRREDRINDIADSFLFYFIIGTTFVLAPWVTAIIMAVLRKIETGKNPGSTKHKKLAMVSYIIAIIYLIIVAFFVLGDSFGFWRLGDI